MLNAKNTLFNMTCRNLCWVEPVSTHVAEMVCQLMACQNVFFSAVEGREVGGRDAQLLKHVVEWCDAKGTICCLAIKHHPHKDWAVANVKEIKATANHQQKWWSTPHDPRCTSQQPTQAGFILLTSRCVTAVLALHWNQRLPARTDPSAL